MKIRINIAVILLLFAGIVLGQRNTNSFEPVTITGSITEVNHPIAVFKADDGVVYQIHMGPYWYWLNNGYKLNNETATIKGEVKTLNDVNELYPVEVTQNGNTIKLTDDKGVPLWASNFNNGYGRGYGRNNANCMYDSVKCANCTNPGSCCKNGNRGRNGYGWNNDNNNGNGRGRGYCRRNNADENSQQNYGRGWRQNCPYNNK